jgi:hypothetical protein
MFNAAMAGVEVEIDDINLMAEAAALSEDHVYAEIFRPEYFSGAGAAKGIVQYGLREQGSTGTYPQSYGVVVSSGIGNASVYVPEFRALIGSRTTLATSPDKFRNDVRTAVSNAQNLQLAATVSNHRYDLIYARVTPDNPNLNQRYVKSADGLLGVVNLPNRLTSDVVLGVVTGTEGASPALPALPADTLTNFYVPLAYVQLEHPHALTDTIEPYQIREVAPVVSLAPAVGGVDMRPASFTNKVGGALPAWPIGGRPIEYMAPTMVGQVSRVFGLSFFAGYASLALGTTRILDDSCDWRNRIFRTSVQSSDLGEFGWAPAVITSSTALPHGVLNDGFAAVANHMLLGNSFHTAPACRLNPDSVLAMAVGSQIDLKVNMTTGALEAIVGATDPQCLLTIWVEATAQFSNAR